MVEKGDRPDALWRAMADLDWPGLAIPAALGGVGLSFVETAIVIEELGRVMAPGPYLATATQFAPCIREVGDAEQQSRFLGAVAAGNCTGTLALVDRPRHWDLAKIDTTATRHGQKWSLQGTKRSVMTDPEVDEVAVVARVGEGLGVFVVPGSDVAITAVPSFDGSRPLATVVLDDVSVTADRALGEPGSEATLLGLTRAVQEATVGVALETVGTCQSLFDLTLAYTKDRKQFGVAIGSFQAIKHKMVDLYVSIERARALAYLAVAAIDEDDPQRQMATAMAKAAADDCQRLVCQESIQTLGGIGFTWEHDAHLYVKRAKTLGTLFGDGREQRQVVASLLGVASQR